MIVYFDTSAFVSLLVAEPSSEFCGRLWDEADTVATTRLLYVETATALAQARRLDRLTERSHQSALRGLRRLWAEMDLVDVDDGIAEQSDDRDLVVACGDRKLLEACAPLGMSTADVNIP